MKTIFLVLALTIPAFSQAIQAPKPDKLWKVSMATVAGAEVADVASSWGLYELNPVLGRGQFGLRQASIKGGVAGAGLVAEWILVKKWPKFSRTFRWVNFGVSAELGAVAWHNYHLKGR